MVRTRTITPTNRTQLAPAKFRTTGCTLAGFHDKFLFKFGGVDHNYQEVRELEVYNVRRDVWYLVPCLDQNGVSWSNFPSGAGAVQINKDEMLLFGGSRNDTKSEDSWLLSVDFADNVSEVRVKRYLPARAHLHKEHTRSRSPAKCDSPSSRRTKPSSASRRSPTKPPPPSSRPEPSSNAQHSDGTKSSEPFRKQFLYPITELSIIYCKCRNRLLRHRKNSLMRISSSLSPPTFTTLLGKVTLSIY